MRKINKGLYQILESNLYNNRETKPFGFVEGRLIKTEKSRKFTTYTLETGVKHPRDFINKEENIFWEKGIFFVKLKEWSSGKLFLSSFFYSNNFALPNRSQGYLDLFLMSRKPKGDIYRLYVGPKHRFLNGKKLFTKAVLADNSQIFRGLFLGVKRTFLKGRYIPFKPFYIKSKKRHVLFFDSRLVKLTKKKRRSKPLRLRFKPPYMVHMFWGGSLHQIPVKFLGILRRPGIKYRSLSQKKWPYKRYDFFLLWSLYKLFCGVVYKLSERLGDVFVTSRTLFLYKSYLYFLYFRLIKIIGLYLKRYRRRIIPLYLHFFYKLLLRNVFLTPSFYGKKFKSFDELFVKNGAAYSVMFGGRFLVNKNIFLFFLLLSFYKFSFQQRTSSWNGLSQGILEYRGTVSKSFFDKKNRYFQIFKLYGRKKMLNHYKKERHILQLEAKKLCIKFGTIKNKR